MFPLFAPFSSLKLPVLFSGPPLFSILKAPMCLQGAGRRGEGGGALALAVLPGSGSRW